MDIGSARRPGRRGAACGAVVVLALTALLALVPGAQAAEFLYWENFRDGTLSVAKLDGSGGGPVNTTGIDIDSSDGLAYDPIADRLFLANGAGGDDGQINLIELDGRGAAVFTAPGAPVVAPRGIAVDPVSRTVYWANHDPMPSLAWAKLDGSRGGVLSTAGARFEEPERIALDPGAGRIYWVNEAADTVGFARVDNSGGGELPITGATPPAVVYGVAVDPVAGRLYWLEVDSRISSIPLAGGAGADLSTAGAPMSVPTGLALDPTAHRIYWANSPTNDGTNAFGFASLFGGGGGIDVATAPADGPQDPLIIKSPAGVAAPTIAQGARSLRSALSCSNGAWAPDFPGSFVYQAPTRFSYQWTLDGAPVAGATSATLNATSPGRYACVVTASNHAGSAAQTSAAAVDLKAAKFKLTAKKKVTAAAGGVAKLKVTAANQGDLQAGKAKLCVKVPKKAKKDLKAPKCKPLGAFGSDGSKAVTLKVKVGPEATGTYRLKVRVKGAAGKAAAVAVQIR